MSNDEFNRLIEDHINNIFERYWKKTSKKIKEEWRVRDKEEIIKRAKDLSKTGLLTHESVKTAITINQLIEAHINYIFERYWKKTIKRIKEEWRIKDKEKIIKKAIELSENEILTLESVKAAIQEREEKREAEEKKTQEFIRKERKKQWIIGSISWVVLTFLLALIINLAFWGALISKSGKDYWETLFSDGLWAFLVGGFGAIVIIIEVSQEL